MAATVSSLLRSLLVTYSFEDYDDAGLRAVVPRAVPLEPPFNPRTLSYKVEVPSDVEDLEFEAPHSPQNQIEITGHTGLRHGKNTVKLILTNSSTGERVSYQLTVERRRRRRKCFFTFVTIGTFASVAVIGTIFLTKHLTQKQPKPLVEIEKSGGNKEVKGWWRQKFDDVFELAIPYL